MTRDWYLSYRDYFSDFQILEQRTQRNACISFAESRQNSPKGQIFPHFFILLPPTQGDKRGSRTKKRKPRDDFRFLCYL